MNYWFSMILWCDKMIGYFVPRWRCTEEKVHDDVNYLRFQFEDNSLQFSNNKYQLNIFVI